MHTEKIETFYRFDFTPYQLPVIAVYKISHIYVARLFDMEKPTPYAVIRPTLEAVRQEIPTYRFTKLQPMAGDVLELVETWI